MWGDHNLDTNGRYFPIRNGRDEQVNKFLEWLIGVFDRGNRMGINRSVYFSFSLLNL